MVERSIRLKKLGDQDIERNRSMLRSGTVCKLTGGRTFNITGTLELWVPPGPRGFEPIREMVFVRGLLRYDPQRFILKTSSEDGNLLIFDNFLDLKNRIPPQNVRVVDTSLSEIGIVRKSGYVLGRRWYRLGKKRVPTDEFEKILVQAEEGIKPFSHMDIPYIKVDPDPDLVGYGVHVLFFQASQGKNQWDRDAVVIDPTKRKLIERQVLRPLSAERWIKQI